eukprot:gene9622-1826_t
MDLSNLPPNLKTTLLTLLSEQKETKEQEEKNSKPEIKKEDLELSREIKNQLETTGYCIIDNFLDKKIAESIQKEISELKETNQLSNAGFGTGKAKVVNSDIRGDLHKWMDQKSTPKNMKKAIVKCYNIKNALNEEFDLNLTSSSIQSAIYPSNGTRYQKHADATPLQASDRKLTLLMYFNKPDEIKGGNLKLYPNERSFDTEKCYQNENESVEIEPKFNRLLVFFSECFHEVLPSYFERFSLTYWISGLKNIHSIFVKKKKENEKLIFVSICSYRDSECQYTIKDLFEKSKFKNRIICGICHQYDENTDKHLFKEEYQYPDQIREIHLPYQFAKGPGFARHLIQKYLFKNEDYYLQIDSHMRFEKNWDENLINQLIKSEKISNSKTIISTYPMGYKLPNELPKTKEIILMCAKDFSDDQNVENFTLTRFTGKVISCECNKPIESLFWAAGFSFSRGDIVKIPYDSLEYIFFGEEIYMLSKFFKAGYKIFAPSEVILYHLWSREHRPSFRQEKMNLDQIKKIDVDKKYLTIDSEKEKKEKKDFWMKEIKKSISSTDFQDYIGIDFEKKEISSKAINGGFDRPELLL